MKIPILTYHSQNIHHNAYDQNDHLALAADLRTINTAGFTIVPLHWIVDWILGLRDDLQLHKTIAITFDDGTDFDFYDLDHPTCGRQRSFYHILCDFQADFGAAAQPHLCASAFVIASPVARKDIYLHDLAGFPWISDCWWREAQLSGLMSIHNHSWDHNHASVNKVCQKEQRKGSFSLIDTYQECCCEVQQAAEYIYQRIAPAWPTLFAYPYGQASAYIENIYFPNFSTQHRTRAAFGASGGYVTKVTSRWNVPRFVCGAHWRSPAELRTILDGAER